MITGIVNGDREGVIRLRVRGANGQEREVEGVIDTGFNGFLTLPPALIAALGCPRIGFGRTLMANGKEELFDMYETTVFWDGQPRTVETDGADTDALVGMSLIYGYELRMQGKDSGRVTIEALP